MHLRALLRESKDMQCNAAIHRITKRSRYINVQRPGLRAGEIMSKQQNGGPAFPQSGVCTPEIESWDSNDFGGRGLSMRDYFAAKAMQARLSNPDWLCSDERTAADAYAMADAMLRAREAS